METSIAGRLVGGQHTLYIIAEAGSNHNGSFELAKQLMDITAEAGVDAAKLQIFRVEENYSKFTPDFTSMKGQKVFRLMKQLDTSRSCIPRPARTAVKRNVHFLSTPFDLDAVDALKDHVPAFKTASFEPGDLEPLSYAVVRATIGLCRSFVREYPAVITTGVPQQGEPTFYA